MKKIVEANRTYYFAVGLYLFFTILVMIFSLDVYGNYRFFTNRSSSMEPYINRGSITLVKKENFYQIGDVIAYYSQKRGQEEVVTHRIMQIGGNVYLTKGDANPGFDRPLILPRLIIGRVTMVIPYLGYLLTFAKSKIGMGITIVLPAIIIVFWELRKVWFILKAGD